MKTQRNLHNQHNHLHKHLGRQHKTQHNQHNPQNNQGNGGYNQPDGPNIPSPSAITATTIESALSAPWGTPAAPTILSIAAIVVLASLSVLQSCSTPPGHPPVARLTVQPSYIPAGEPTEVFLDGRRSCDQLDAPDGCVAADETPPLDCPNGLRYHWTVSQDLALLDGGPDQPWMHVSVTTDKPVTVTLTVTDCDGRTASVTRQIGVILSWPEEKP